MSVRYLEEEGASLRLPPMSIEAEQAVLGGLMLSPAAMDKISDRLSERDFYRRDHRLIFRSIAELLRKGKPVDAVTMGEWLEANGILDQAGGSGYLIDLASTTPSAANIRAYAGIVREKAILRELIEVGTQIVNDGFQPEGRQALDILGSSLTLLGSVMEAEPCELETASEVLKQMTDDRARRHELGGELDGLSTGFPELDGLLCGLKPGQLIVIAGRPKMGKTTLAMNIAEHACTRMGKRVAVHSLEMLPKDLLERACCSIGRVPHDLVRHSSLSDQQEAEFAKASGKLARAGLMLSRPRVVRGEQLVAQTRRSHAQARLDLVVIDYLQLIDMIGAERRDLGVGDVTRALKLMAVSLGVPVILLSQLNRNLEARPDKRPVPSDLRDGGSIEQDADAVIFVYRDEVYHSRSPDRGTAEIIVALQRGGPTGTVRLRSRLDLCRFDPLEEGWTPAMIEESKPARGRKSGFPPSHKDHRAGVDRDE